MCLQQDRCGCQNNPQIPRFHFSKPTSMHNTTLGLKANWQQFTLLVIINAFVGGMVGLERSIIPELAEVEFGIAAKSAILSFIIVFGVVKAITNYYTGALANR